MSRDEDPVRSEVEATVPLVVRGVTKKHATCRTGRQLVRSSGGDVRVTCTPEDTKVTIVRRGTEKSLVWSRSRTCSGRETVEQVGGGMKALSPEARGQGGLDQKGAHDVVRRAKHALGLAVLRGSIRTRHAQLNTLREKERARSVVIKLTPVVTLNGLDSETKLCGHPGKEVEEGGKSLRLGA
jgi:hypothetical protein